MTGRNGADVVAAVRFALQHKLLFNLNFYRENDLAQGHAELLAEDERLIATLEECFAAIAENPPQHSLLPSLVDRANFATPHEHACGAGHSYLVVDQRGAVARCQMELEQPVSDIWADDPLQEIRLYSKGFQNTSSEAKQGCRECDWRYWCAGGCPKLTYRITGRNDLNSPYCHVYKAIYPQLISLEANRLLRHYSRGGEILAR